MPTREEAITELYRRREQLGDRQRAAVEELARRMELIPPSGEPEAVAPPPEAAPTTASPAREQAMQEMAEEIGPLQAFMIGAGKGFTNFVRGIAPEDPKARERFSQTLPLLGEQTEQMLQETPEEQQAMSALKEQRPIAIGAGEITGEVAPFIPASGVAGMARTVPGRVAAGGALGGTEGGILAEDTVKGAGIGASIGMGAEVLFPVVGRLGRKIFERVTGKTPKGAMLTAQGQPTPELEAALNEAGMTFGDLTDDAVNVIKKGSVDPAQAARKGFLESQGVQPTRAQVTRDAADFQAQQEAAKTSGRIRDVLENQEAVLTTRFNDAITATTGAANNPTVTVIDKVVDKATTLDKQISDLYKRARESAPGEKIVRFDNLAETLRRYAPQDRRTGGNIQAIVGELKHRGVLGDRFKVRGKIDVETSEEIRKTLNELYDPQNPYGNMILRELKEKLDEDVFKGAGQDLFKEARAAKASFEQELQRAKINKFDSRKQNLVRDLLENKIDPDRFVDTVAFGKSWRPDDLQQLKNYVGEGPEWNDLKAEVLQSIKERSFIGPEDASGFKALSRAKLESAIDRIGWKKLGAIFDNKEIKFLEDILKVAKLREPVRGTAIGKGPSAQAIASLENKLKQMPLFGFLVDVINIDAAGRSALKAKPQKLTAPPSRLERELSAPAAAVATGAAVKQEENQQ